MTADIPTTAFVVGGCVFRGIARPSSRSTLPTTPPHDARKKNCPASPSVVMAAKRSRRTVQDDSNAVDVFAPQDLDPDALLAAALAADEPAPAKPQKPKKDKSSKKKSIHDDDDDANAVDVFGGVGLSQDELLAAALGDQAPVSDPSPSQAHPPTAKVSKKKMKQDAKATTVQSIDNADAALSPVEEEHKLETLSSAADELSVPDHQTVSASDVSHPKKSKKKHKDQLVIGEDESNVEPFVTPSGVDTAAPDVQNIATVDGNIREHRETDGDQRESDARSGIVDQQDQREDDLEDFEPEAEVLAEFNQFSEQVVDFTLSGRRKTARETRTERFKQESRLGDAKRAHYGTGGEKFTSVRLEDVTVTFRNTTILKGVTWGVKTGDRVGLVGQNGCGKTTQLRIMAGLLEPTTGEVVRSSSRTRSSFLRQEFVDELDPTRTLREEFLSAFTEEQALLKEYQNVEREIEIAGTNLQKLDLLLNRMEELRQECDSRNAWQLDSRIDRVMPGLGFVEEDSDKLVASFSGGWKVRIGIGKVLLQDPDLLLLDEPSNHLDLQSVEWLEEYLRNCVLPMVIVSHDREFLNRVCNKIVDIDGGEAFEYPGNYSRFVVLKAERRKAWESAYERQSKFIQEQRQYIKQNRTSAARSKQVKSREKMLERMERTGQLVRQPPRGGKPLVFRFPPAPRSGRDVIVLQRVTHGYGDRVLLKDVSIGIERGDRIAVIGPNGCGKSTLLRLITGKEKPQEGSVECSELHNVKLAYFEQNQADVLDLSITVLETLKRAAPGEMTYEEIRALLGKFLFKGDAVEKLVSSLSGGEKARLALAKMMLEPANVMVLDEPTNHIDAAAMDMLEEALQNYDGTLVVVSHDRYFVSQVAKQILYIEDQELMFHDGDYKSFMEKDKAMKALAESRFVEGTEGIKNAPEINIDLSQEVNDPKQKRKKNFGGSGVQSGRVKEMNAKRWNK